MLAAYLNPRGKNRKQKHPKANIYGLRGPQYKITRLISEYLLRRILLHILARISAPTAPKYIYDLIIQNWILKTPSTLILQRESNKITNALIKPKLAAPHVLPVTQRPRRRKVRIKSLQFKRVLKKNIKYFQKKKKRYFLSNKPLINLLISIKLKLNTNFYWIRRKREKQQATIQLNKWFRKFKINPPKSNHTNKHWPHNQQQQMLTYFLVSTYKKKRPLATNKVRIKSAKLLYKTAVFKNTLFTNLEKLVVGGAFVRAGYASSATMSTRPPKKTPLNPISNMILIHIHTKPYFFINPPLHNMFYSHKKPAARPVVRATHRKQTILFSLFDFNNTNLSSNSLTVTQNINFSALLNIKTSALNLVVPKSINLNIKPNNPQSIYISNCITHPHYNKINPNNFAPLFWFSHHNIYKKNLYNTLLYNAYTRNIAPANAQKYKNFYTFFLINFLENYLKKKIWIRTDCRDFFSGYWGGYLNKNVQIPRIIYRRFIRLIDVRELLEIIILMFVTRDLQIFLIFLKRCFEKSHFKKHKKILSIVFDIFRKNKIIMHQAGIKGFFFDIRGKVGVSGNAKKRHVLFSLGKITTTSQNFKSYWQQISIWTPTGQMGVTCYILF